MNHLGCALPAQVEFIQQEGDELWVHNPHDRQLTFYTKWIHPAAVRSKDGRVIGYGTDYNTWAIEPKSNQVIECELDKQLAWGSYGAIPSVFSILNDPRDQMPVKTEPRFPYDVLGVCALTGESPKTIGPLHCPGIRGGRLVVDITDAICTGTENEYGIFTVQSSHDGSDWFDLDQNGFSEGPVIIPQKSLSTGEQYVGEFFFTNHGEYIRVQYNSNRIAGWGFKASATIETKS